MLDLTFQHCGESAVQSTSVTTLPLLMLSRVQPKIVFYVDNDLLIITEEANREEASDQIIELLHPLLFEEESIPEVLYPGYRADIPSGIIELVVARNRQKSGQTERLTAI